MKVINLLGGAGCGKSTFSYRLVYEFKVRGVNVEHVSEYAKYLTWTKDFGKLSDPLMVVANQNHLLETLKDQVEYVVMDTSLLNTLVYSPDYFDSFKSFVLDLFNSYENFNIFLARNEEFYTPIGRNEDLQGAKTIDQRLKKLLKNEKIFYRSFNPAYMSDENYDLLCKTILED